MKLGILKNILQENELKLIVVMINSYKKPLVLIHAEFDIRTRSIVFLKVVATPPPRTNNYNMIKSYLLDFKDSHTLYIENIDKNNTIYSVESEFEIDKAKKILYLHAGRHN